MNNHYLLHAAPYPVASYDIASAWQAIYAKFPKPEYIIPVAVFNAAHGVWKPFPSLDVTPQEVQDCLQINMATNLITATQNLPYLSHPTRLGMTLPR
jgi:NAD(P)-dependent dehydrogenase (short-subunit alcohol dehydrogenase family)